MDDDAPLPARGAYNIDFDNLDAFDPFATKTKIMNNFDTDGIAKVRTPTEPLAEKSSANSMKVCYHNDNKNDSIHSSPDENRNPNPNVPSKRVKPLTKPAASKAATERKKKVDSGGAKQMSLKEKIAEMRKKKEQEKKEQQQQQQAVPSIDTPNDENIQSNPSYLNNLPVQRKGSNTATNPSDINLPDSAYETNNLQTPPRSPKSPRSPRTPQRDTSQDKVSDQNLNENENLNETEINFKTPCAKEKYADETESMSILKLEDMSNIADISKTTPTKSFSNNPIISANTNNNNNKNLLNGKNSNKNLVLNQNNNNNQQLQSSHQIKKSPLRNLNSLPKIDQKTIEIIQIVSNAVQRDALIYESAFERYQSNRERTLKEANNRADIEEEYNQVKHRYDKLRDNQKKSELPNLKNTVFEQSKNKEQTYSQAIIQQRQILQDFIEFKRNSDQKLIAMEHELTVAKGKLKMTDHKQNFQERKIASQDDQIRNLQEEVEIMKQEKIAMEAESQQLKSENKELAVMVEELMKHHEMS